VRPPASAAGRKCRVLPGRTGHPSKHGANLADITDEEASLEMIADADKADNIIARAGQVTAAVREQIRA
jgi:hypothetical protein